jgi:hypothetical protein
VELRDLPRKKPPFQQHLVISTWYWYLMFTHALRELPKMCLVLCHLPIYEAHQVAKLFPKMFPTTPSILSHLVCPKFNSPLYKLRRYSKLEHILFLFCFRGPKADSIEKCHEFPKKLVDVAPSPKLIKGNVWETHELINMNHTFCWVLLALPTEKARILCLESF